MKDWIETYERYIKQVEEGTLYTGNSLDKLKVIYKNIYTSPIEFGDLYFEIGKRLEIAKQIRHDIRNLTEEN